MPDNFFDESNRRMPTEFKRIEDIKPEDVRVAIIGTVVNKEEYILVIDDGSGNIEVEFESEEKTEDFEESDKVRVIGRPSDDIFYGEFVQDLSDIDLELYEKAREKMLKEM